MYDDPTPPSGDLPGPLPSTLGSSVSVMSIPASAPSSTTSCLPSAATAAPPPPPNRMHQQPCTSLATGSGLSGPPGPHPLSGFPTRAHVDRTAGTLGAVNAECRWVPPVSSATADPSRKDAARTSATRRHPRRPDICLNDSRKVPSGPEATDHRVGRSAGCCHPGARKASGLEGVPREKSRKGSHSLFCWTKRNFSKLCDEVWDLISRGACLTPDLLNWNLPRPACPRLQATMNFHFLRKAESAQSVPVSATWPGAGSRVAAL